MSWLFLFGAGASYGSGQCTPRAPPLGGDLFAELRTRGGEAAGVDDELASLFAADFEKGMDRFFETRNAHVSAFLREIAEYFAQFEPLAGNCYAELLATLARSRRKATFASLNYDLLLEMAASQIGLRVAYHGLPVPKSNVPVLKIHGSCNFWPDLGGSRIQGVAFDISSAGSASSIVEAPIRVARSSAEIVTLCRREDSIGPALAMYAPGKRILYCRQFIETQRSHWLEAVSKASAVYLIGVRVHVADTHIWEPLARGRAPTYYVGPGSDPFSEWASRERGGARKSAVLADSFRAALPLIARHARR